jgi:hypothetical protein
MQTRIGHLHLHYRLPHGSTVAAGILPTLERVARERISTVCDHAFSEVFADDATVRVIKKVSSRVAVISRQTTLESQLAQQWGQRLSTAVVEAIADESSDNVVCFENQAEFVASFLIDVTKGDAWTKWYYGAFATYRELSVPEMILSVLEDNREWLKEIFRRLNQAGALASVLDQLGRTGRKTLALKVFAVEPRQPRQDAFQIFIRSALSLIDALDLWIHGRPDEDQLLQSYVDSHPAAVSWTNPTSLASAVLDVIQFIIRERWVRPETPLGEDQISQLKDVLAHRFDWLDIPYLTEQVLHLLIPSSPSSVTRELVLRPQRSTPAQARVIELLLRLIREGKCELDHRDPEPHSNLLRIFASLAEHGNAMSVSGSAQLLESVLSLWIALRDSGEWDLVLHVLRDRPESLSEIPKLNEDQAVKTALQTVAAAGGTAISLLEALLEYSQTTDYEPGAVPIETNCVGLFLLVRALQDLRLRTVLKESEFHSFPSLLTGLAIRLGGPAAWQNSLFDQGAAIWAGIDAEDALIHLSLLETMDRDYFETVLHDQLVAQGLVLASDSSTLNENNESLPSSAGLLAMLDRTGARVLQAWARWLPGLGQSSAAYLLRNFIVRPGAIAVTETFIDVQLPHGSLDSILQMAGYLSDTPAVPWLGDRRVRFRITA